MEIKDGRKIFDWPIKNYLRTYDNRRNFTTGQSDYTIGFLLDHLCFKNHYKLIAIALSRPQKLYPDPKTIQQIECTGDLYRTNGRRKYFIITEATKTTLDLKGTVKALSFYFVLIKC